MAIANKFNANILKDFRVWDFIQGDDVIAVAFVWK